MVVVCCSQTPTTPSTPTAIVYRIFADVARTCTPPRSLRQRGNGKTVREVSPLKKRLTPHNNKHAVSNESTYCLLFAQFGFYVCRLQTSTAAHKYFTCRFLRKDFVLRASHGRWVARRDCVWRMAFTLPHKCNLICCEHREARVCGTSGIYRVKISAHMHRVQESHEAHVA